MEHLNSNSKLGKDNVGLVNRIAGPEITAVEIYYFNLTLESINIFYQMCSSWCQGDQSEFLTKCLSLLMRNWWKINIKCSIVRQTYVSNVKSLLSFKILWSASGHINPLPTLICYGLCSRNLQAGIWINLWDKLLSAFN